MYVETRCRILPSHSRVAFSNMVEYRLELDRRRMMTSSTSEVAVCCSRASIRSRVSRATFVSLPAARNCDGVRPLAHCGASTSWGVAFLLLCRLFCRAVSLPPPRLRTGHRINQVAHWKGWARDQPMSALGQKRTCAAQKVMSALPPIADICSALADVRFVPKADIRLQTLEKHLAFVRSPQASRSQSHRCGSSSRTFLSSSRSRAWCGNSRLAGRLILETEDKHQVCMAWKGLRHGPKEVMDRANVRLEVKSRHSQAKCHVRFAPNSGHGACNEAPSSTLTGGVPCPIFRDVLRRSGAFFAKRSRSAPNFAVSLPIGPRAKHANAQNFYRLVNDLRAIQIC